MTTAYEPSGRPGALARFGRASARGWRRFRRWRRGRPFWGGFWLILGGVQLFLSSNLSLGGIKVHFGPEGFLSYLLPLLLLMAGVLVWVTPQQRVFYGVIGALTAVYSLIGLNLGGFLLGMLFGIIGSALAIAWTPVRLENPPAEPAPRPEPEDEGYAEEPAPATFDDLMTGPLTDTLPPPVNPLADGVPDANGREAEPHSPDPPAGPAAPNRPAGPAVPHQRPPSPDSEQSGDGAPPSGSGGTPPRRSPPLYSIVLVLLALGVATVVALRGAAPAYAAPCQPAPTRSSSPSATVVPSSAAPSTAPSSPAAATPTAPAAATPTAPATPGSGLVGAFIGGIGGAVDAAVGVSPTAGPGATRPVPQATTPVRGCAATPSRGAPSGAGPKAPVKRLAVVAGQPQVAARPSRLTGSRVTMDGLSFDGVVDLPTKSGGTVRALQFSMDKSVTTDFTLTTPDVNGARAVFKTKALTVAGHVKFYASRFAANLCDPITEIVCVIPVVFTPDSPPPLTLPNMAFTDPDIQLVFVDSDTLTGTPSLDVRVET
ncbi:MAG TPA: DUF6114 domain-containing protein [Micromonosporaceae bacterium]